MVPDNSPGISRAPGYSGAGLIWFVRFAYGTVTRSGPTFQTVLLQTCRFAAPVL